MKGFLFSLFAHLVLLLRLQGQTLDDLPTVTLPQIGAGPALIIAVDDYGGDSAFANLPGIAHDWKTVKATLLKLGYQEGDITVLQNPSQEEMLAAMNRFGELAAATRKASFFYFTGHGVLLDGKNFLIPAHAPIRVQGHLTTYAVPIEHVLGYLGGEDSGPALVFVDACRNNSLPRTTKSATRDFALERRAGLFIGYATGEGRISNASDDGSVFTASLCRRLLTPGRSVDDLYAGVINDVQKDTAGENVPQDPQKQSALRFVFHLVPGSNAAPGPAGMSEAEIQRRVEIEMAKRMAPSATLSGTKTSAAAPDPAPPLAGSWMEMTPLYPRPIRGTPAVPLGDIPNLEKHDLEATKARLTFKVPVGTQNVAKGQRVTSSDPLPIIGTLDLLTDGDNDGQDGCYVELAPGTQWMQIDLGAEYQIWKVLLWHFHKQPAVYFETRVLVSNDPEFNRPTHVIFNNSLKDDGRDPAYLETNYGRLIDAKGVKGRYVRFYSSGNTSNEMNHYVEAAVYGTPAGIP